MGQVRSEETASPARRYMIVAALGAFACISSARADIITQIGGDVGTFAVLYTGGAGQELHLAQGTITGNIGVGGTGTVAADGSGSINGNVDFSASKSGSGQYSGSKPLNGSVYYGQTDVTSDLTDVGNFSAAVNAEPGYDLGSINLSSGQTLTIEASSGTLDSSGNRVFKMTSLTADSGSTITIVGDGSGDNVILNIDTGGSRVTLDGNIVLNGITADQVFFNVTGGGELKVVGATGEGVFADPNGQIFVSAATLGGHIFGGDNSEMQIVSNSNIDARTPEPAALFLCATVLAGCWLVFKSRWIRRER
jgi:hypothetical protein